MDRFRMALRRLLLIGFITSLFFDNSNGQSNHAQFQETIETVLDSLYDVSTDFAGATIGIVLPDNSKFGFALGYANVEDQIKMNPNDRMLGGSTGKIFVSAAIMRLIEQGELNLDDKIVTNLGDNHWFDRVQNYDQITIRNLMQHASGISRYVFEEKFQLDIIVDADRVWTPEELIGYVLDKEPLFDAGSDFAYADTNYILLAMILEKVSHQSMYENVAQNILIPFNLSSISPQVDRKIDGLVMGYNKIDDDFFPGKTLENGKYKYNLQFEWAGGGFVMNSQDLALAGKLIYESDVFDASLMRDFLNGIDAKRLGGTWGLGVHIKETPMGLTYGHSGFFPGYITNMLYFPEYNFAIAIQVNTSDNSKLSLYRKLYQIIPVIKEYLAEN